jgi:pyruvate kinase
MLGGNVVGKSTYFMKNMNNTEKNIKIIPTLGIYGKDYYKSVCTEYKKLQIDTIRVNLTRYTLDEYVDELDEFLKIWNEICDYEIKWMFDIPYPGEKSRISFGGSSPKIEVKAGDIIKVYTEDEFIDSTNLYLPKESNIFNCTIGDTLIIDDGKISSSVVDVQNNHFALKIKNDGYIGYKKSIYLEDKIFTLLENEHLNKFNNFFEKFNTCYVVYSFVENCNYWYSNSSVDDNTSKFKKVAKVETKKGCENIQEINEKSDYIMIGRGDLFIDSGLEINYYQEKIINNVDSEKLMIATFLLQDYESSNLLSAVDIIQISNLKKSGINYFVLSGALSFGEKIADTYEIINRIK